MKEYETLAKILAEYSCKLKRGENVYISYNDGVDSEFIKVLIKQVRKLGAYPFLFEKKEQLQRELIKSCDELFCERMTKFYLPIMQDMNAYIGIAGEMNSFELGDVPNHKMQIFTNLFTKPVELEERVNNTKWVILNWPTPSLAQNAKVSTENYVNLFFKVCTLNYAKMSRAMDGLVRLMEKTDRVRLIARDTDISFSIKGQPAIKCDGKNNIPDGEVFTAPILHTVNGKITYNVPTIYNGIRFDDVCLEVENGRIFKASCFGFNKQLNQILDTDYGGRSFGEFAIGLNPFIVVPTCDILFDEKMYGSIHLTPGACYEECPNGNKSAIHWDMVLCQTKEFGGGEIYFDDVLVRKNGEFVLDELKQLNKENLK